MLELYLLQFLGICYILIGIGMMLNTVFFKAMYQEFLESKANFLWGGFLSAMFGYAFVLVGVNSVIPGVEFSFLEGLVFLLGVLALLKAAMFLIFPEKMRQLLAWFIANNFICKKTGAAVLIFGLFFIFLTT